MIEQFGAGAALALQPYPLAAAIGGLILGVIVGAIPGLTATMTIAILTPFTFFLPPTVAIGALLGIYKGAVYGGSIPAILINTPGTAAAAATSLDGHVLARQGRAREALQMSLFASVAGDMLATVVLVVVAAPLAAFAVTFSAPEYTMLFVVSLLLIAGVSGGNPFLGLVSACFGALLGCIGMDPMTGTQRYVFGVTDLLGGISLVPLLIGMFALSEVLVQAGQRGDTAATLPSRAGGGQPLRVVQMKAVAPTILRSSGIGAFIGALPGLGAEIACWIGYAIAKRRSRHPDLYGKGSLEGIAAAESANNASVPGTLIPMLVFGIPGDVVTAVLLGAFIAQGLTPGPLLFVNHGSIIYALYVLLIITNAALIAVGIGAIGSFRRLANLPRGLILPCVSVLCAAGAFAVNSSGFDVILMFAGGFAGYGMRRIGMPIPPLIIALLIAPSLEGNLRQALAFSSGDPSIFITRPISAGIIALFSAALLFVLWQRMRRSSFPTTQSERMP